MGWLDVLGWGGSALLVFSLLQARVLRFRALNLVACLVLVTFNAFLGIWPMVAMNIVLSAINIWFLVRLLHDRHDEAAFSVLQVRPNDAYLRHVLKVHGADIAKHQPGFTGVPVGSTPYLIQRADETVGVVVLRVQGGTALIDLDYVTPRFRDFSPGEFVWRQSELLRRLEVDRLVTPPGMVDAYYGKLGFHREDDHYVLDL